MDGKRSLVGSLSNDDDDSNKNGKKKTKKNISLRLAKQQLCTCMHDVFFLCISLPSLQDYDLKLPNFTFCTEREHNTTTSFFFF